ncbi:thiamine phosphate synthase [Pseudochelatococcus lubricantis]|uniref:thiamine phosphate synthase n=1 Tax=Pseudochelatococcus lubricantis TaxID=1538102 RepID=UPI0035ED4450
MPASTTNPETRHSPRPVDLRLYAILDPERSRGRPLPELARAAIAGGVTLLQYRDKYADTRPFVANARAILAAIAGTGVPLLINDRVDVALAAGADGVHVGQDDMTPADARRLLGPDAIVGLTLNNVQEAADATREPIDYGCIGGVFATSSKDNPKPPIGLGGLADVVASAQRYAPHLPLAAIAGIDETNAAAVIAAGAEGVSVISAILMADDVTLAARRLRAIVDNSLAARGRPAGYGQGADQ